MYKNIKFGLGDQQENISVGSNPDNRISRIQAVQIEYGSLTSIGKNKQYPTEIPGIARNITNNNSRTSKSEMEHCSPLWRQWSLQHCM